MPILAMSAGTVTAVWGNAFIRQADGSLKPVKVGDKVAGGERIITDADGLVQISPAKGHPQLIKAQAHEAAPSVDKAIAGIESQDPQEAPAAGLTGGADGGMQPGLRVERVSESITPSALSLGNGAAANEAAAVQTGSSADQRALASETPSQASINDIIVDETSGTATFTVTLDKPSTGVVAIPFATKGDTASTGDFMPTSGTLSFQPGETSKTITVPITNDARYEGEERFTVQLGTPTNATLSRGEGTALIHDDEDQPRIAAVSDAQTSEGGALEFHVKLTHESTTQTPLTFKLIGAGEHPAELGSDADAAITVQLGMPTADGQGMLYLDVSTSKDAEGNTVYVLPPLTSTDADILVKVVTRTDGQAESTEQLQLAVSTPYDTTPVVATGTIDDVSPYPHLLVLNGEPATEGEKVGFNLVLTQASTEDITVKLDLASGTDDPYTLYNESAALGVDTGTALEWESAPGVWEAVTGPLTFHAGQTLIHVRLATLDDQAAEVTEFIKLQATVRTGSTANTSHANQTAIDDNDPWLDPVDHSQFDPNQVPETSRLLVGKLDASDVFSWHLKDDHGVDTIAGFDGRSPSAHGDVLDLRDILVGEETPGADLTHFLHFDNSGQDTVIKIAAQGDMLDGHSASNVDTQHIVLEGVNLPADLGLGAGATDTQIIAKLVQQGSLLVDHA